MDTSADGPPTAQAGEPMAASTKPAWPSTPLGDCQRMVARAQERNMTVKFMIDKMAEVCLRPLLKAFPKGYSYSLSFIARVCGEALDRPDAFRFSI